MGVKTNLHMITKKKKNCEHLIQLKQNGALHKFEQAKGGVEKFLPF